MATIINLAEQKKGPGCVGQVLWFVLIGWWLSLLVVSLAWVCMVTVIGIPLGVALINQIPQIVARRQPGQHGLQVIVAGNATVITGAAPVRQHSLLLRIPYFLLIGIWLSGLWMACAWLLCVTLVGMPLGFKMFDATPAVLSLHRS